ncbi:MAG TPA: hypothetical protein VFQ80_17225 [Thermomicrobiales bacterium]|jgi:hypothetical protein|nr:hypothetical protein [Thermomicrobiales bacterium]
MERFWTGRPQLPDRLPRRLAIGLGVLSLATLGIAVGGWFLYEGGHRVAYVTAFTTMSLANLAWAIGSLLPDEAQSRALRFVISPLAAIMMLALGATLAYQWGCGQ